MKNVTSISIRQDLPDIADKIIAAAEADVGLMDALDDYQRACDRMKDARLPPDEQAIWAEIRDELVVEIKRLYQVQVCAQTTNTR